jgi:hypothetical protein
MEHPHTNHIFGHFSLLLNLESPFKNTLQPLWPAIFLEIRGYNYKEKLWWKQTPAASLLTIHKQNWIYPSSDISAVRSKCFSLVSGQSSHEWMWVHQQSKKLYSWEFVVLKRTPLSSRCQTKKQPNGPPGWGKHLQNSGTYFSCDVHGQPFSSFNNMTNVTERN